MISAHKFSGTFAPEKEEKLGLEIYMKMKKMSTIDIKWLLLI